MTIRNKVCYICGRRFAYGQPRENMILDRRPRDVHSDCKRLKEKAERDLARDRAVYEAEGFDVGAWAETDAMKKHNDS
jgi:hypothetical protein